ncbi:hypothetical protein TNCV_639671 [Trichonephila clavipes]|nr:hypothetical protein TNCV_639671 [Trichonephila clavipes]
MALRNKESAMNKMYRCRTRNLAPVHSRRGRECDCEFRANRTLMRSWAESCGLPIISDERHVVDPPLMRKEETEKEEGRGDGKREEKESGREEPALDGLSPFMFHSLNDAPLRLNGGYPPSTLGRRRDSIETPGCSTLNGASDYRLEASLTTFIPNLSNPT